MRDINAKFFKIFGIILLTSIVTYHLSGCAAWKFKKEELPVIPPTPDVVSENGMIVCAHPEAAKVGMEVLHICLTNVPSRQQHSIDPFFVP